MDTYKVLAKNSQYKVKFTIKAESKEKALNIAATTCCKKGYYNVTLTVIEEEDSNKSTN